MKTPTSDHPPKFLTALCAAALLLSVPASGQDLAALSIEQLMDLEVVVASREEQPLFETAAAVAVLTRSDIERSGATTVPDLLRLVPGLQVARLDVNKWAVTARGLNGRFASRLLVLVDGRSVYTTLFSGVHWEQQDLVLEDIERIEVVRGPGAAVWGANAVNGVINIVTRPATAADDTRVSVLAGTAERGASVRSGAALPSGGRLAWSARLFDRDAAPDSSGGSGHDDWRMARVGVRADWHLGADAYTVQSQAFIGDMGETFRLGYPEAPYLRSMVDDTRRQGGHVQVRWQRQLGDDSDLRLQLYHDRFRVRDLVIDGRQASWDLDFQHRFTAGGRHGVVWGAGYRISSDSLAGSPTFSLTPAARDLHLASAFVQDDVDLSSSLRLKLGTRLERHTYTGFEVQPNARLRWQPDERHVFWTSVSRAVRTPSRAERDGRLALSPLPPDSLYAGSPAVLPFVLGDDGFDAEVLRAFEAGWRVRPRADLLLDVSAFANAYDGNVGSRLRLPTAEGDHLVAVIPVANVADVRTRGVESVADWRVTPGARLRASWVYLWIEQTQAPDSAPRGNRGDEDNPAHQVTVWGSFDPRPGWQLDAVGRYVGALPALSVGGYLAGDVRLAWRGASGVEVAVTGRNLIDGGHQEFQSVLLNTVPTQVEPSLHATLTWRR